MNEKPALHGGTPVRKTLLPYGRQEITSADIREVVETLKSPWITTGPRVEMFEKSFAGRVRSGFGVSFSSGTAALHAAMFAADIGERDEVITTPFTFCATSNAVLFRGARPIFADVERDTLNLDPAQVRSRVTKKTKAIVPVDFAGHPADLGSLRRIAREHNLILIEDACHSLGSTWRRRSVGSVSDLTVFSFHPVKHITAGEGGMVTTSSPLFYERLRMFRNHGISGSARSRMEKGQWFYQMEELGFNYRLPDINCALGLSQLRRLGSNLRQRERVAALYFRALRKIPGVTLPSVRPEVRHAWHLFTIRLDPGYYRCDRNEFFDAMRAENIGVNVHYIPVYWHPYYRRRLKLPMGSCPIAEEAFSRIVSLPMTHAMTTQDAHDVIRAVSKVLNHYAVK